MLKQYAYHRILFFLLGKYGWNNIINEAFLVDKNTVITDCDHAEEIKTYFDMKSQSEEFFFICTLSI